MRIFILIIPIFLNKKRLSSNIFHMAVQNPARKNCKILQKIYKIKGFLTLFSLLYLNYFILKGNYGTYDQIWL